MPRDDWSGHRCVCGGEHQGSRVLGCVHDQIQASGSVKSTLFLAIHFLFKSFSAFGLPDLGPTVLSTPVPYDTCVQTRRLHANGVCRQDLGGVWSSITANKAVGWSSQEHRTSPRSPRHLCLLMTLQCPPPRQPSPGMVLTLRLPSPHDYVGNILFLIHSQPQDGNSQPTPFSLGRPLGYVQQDPQACAGAARA